MQEDIKNKPKRSDARKDSTRKTIRFEDSLLERIDKNRAATNTSFAEWVKDACIKKLD
jgi:hypothetical protein